VLAPALALTQTPASLLALIKPQFETRGGGLKKGIVRDARVHARICAEIEAFVTALGWRVEGVVPSVIAGRDGNREFFIAASHD